MTLLWRDTMRAGNSLIDNDHRALLEIINEVEDFLSTPDAIGNIHPILDKLETYTKHHFIREENIMRNIDYPDRLNHLKLHRQLTNTFYGIKSKIIKSSKTKINEENQEEITKLLRHWLINHILGEDLKMKPFLLNAPNM